MRRAWRDRRADRRRRRHLDRLDWLARAALSEKSAIALAKQIIRMESLLILRLPFRFDGDAVEFC